MTDRDPKVNEQFKAMIEQSAIEGRPINPRWGRDITAVAPSLPAGAVIFEWNEPRDARHAVGKWVKVLRGSIGPDRYEQITDFRMDERHHQVLCASGLFRRSQQVEPGVLKYKSDLEKHPWQKGLMQKVANRWAYHGDLMRAIVETKPGWSPRSQRIKYHIYSNSPIFGAMARKAMRKVLEDNGIDEDYLVAQRKHLLESAMSAKDFNAAEKALKGMEQIMSVVQATEDEPLMLEAPEMNIEKLLQAKREQYGQSAILDQHTSTSNAQTIDHEPISPPGDAEES